MRQLYRITVDRELWSQTVGVFTATSNIPQGRPLTLEPFHAHAGLLRLVTSINGKSARSYEDGLVLAFLHVASREIDGGFGTDPGVRYGILGMHDTYGVGGDEEVLTMVLGTDNPRGLDQSPSTIPLCRFEVPRPGRDSPNGLTTMRDALVGLSGSISASAFAADVMRSAFRGSFARNVMAPRRGDVPSYPFRSEVDWAADPYIDTTVETAYVPELVHYFTVPFEAFDAFGLQLIAIDAPSGAARLLQMLPSLAPSPPNGQTWEELIPVIERHGSIELERDIRTRELRVAIRVPGHRVILNPLRRFTVPPQTATEPIQAPSLGAQSTRNLRFNHKVRGTSDESHQHDKRDQVRQPRRTPRRHRGPES